MRKLFLMFVAVAVALTGSYATADAGTVTTKFDDVDITLGGQARSRFEYTDRTMIDGDSGRAHHFFTQRTRLEVGMDAKGIKGFFQLQDVRAWGEEGQGSAALGGGGTTLNRYNADHIDVHQAYIDLLQVAGRPFDLRIGRQELSLDGQRIMGAVDWTQQGRTWDGVKLSANVGPAAVQLWGFKEDERATLGNGDSTALTSETGATRDNNVIGAYATAKPTDKSTISGLMVYQNDDSTAGLGLNRVTMGARGTHAYMGFDGRVEGYYQTGDTKASGVNSEADAFMVGARLGYTFAEVTGKPKITAWYDYLSGDDNLTDNEDEAFDTLYATNHKYYGFMDYFLAPDAHTANLGLQDIAAKFQISPIDKVTVLADIHHFMTAEDMTGGDKTIGQELDLTLNYKYHAHLMIIAGYSHFFNDLNSTERAQMATRFKGTNDADWSYLMLDFKF